MKDDASEGEADEKPPYEVGYGRPPGHTRFQRGQSGNPSGKRKRTLFTGDAVEMVMNEPLGVAAGGRRKRVVADLLVAKKVRHMALNGSLPAAKYLLDRRRRKADSPSNPEDVYDLEKLSDEELYTLRAILIKATRDETAF